jgi:hypothetical protein
MGYSVSTSIKANIFCLHNVDCYLEIVGKLNSLNAYLSRELGIVLPLEFFNAKVEFENLYDQLFKLLKRCRISNMALDPKWLLYLPNPTGGRLDAQGIEEQCKAANTWQEPLRPWIFELDKRILNWPTDYSIIIAKGISKLSGVHEGAHGVAIAINQDSKDTVILIEDYNEIIYHEFLHLLGVCDGYYKDLTTKPGCEKCWMQWEPRKGNSLCEFHSNQLRNFIRINNEI